MTPPPPTKKLGLKLGTDPSLFHVAGSSTPKICLYLNWLGAHQCEWSYPRAFVAAEEHSLTSWCGLEKLVNETSEEGVDGL